MKKSVKKSPEILNKICQYITEGKSLRTICKLDGMPSIQSAMKWLNNDDEFYKMYKIARENQGDLYGEMINDIAMDLINGKRNDFQNCRVAIDGLKWTVSKMNSKWSERQTLDVNQTNSYVDELSKVQDTIRQRLEEKNKEKLGLRVVDGAKTQKKV
tara:strand:- start:2402 stop:2872 length:471 start_codon:yes stop_codon:yes gene_type:complete